MDPELRKEIWNHEFADDLKLNDVVNCIDVIYRRVNQGWSWQDIEDDLWELKEILKEKTKEHDNFLTNYGNWRDKLAVVHARKPYKETFVTAIWDCILFTKSAYLPEDCSGDYKIRVLLDEVIDTAEDCGIGVRVFPMSHIVEELELYSYNFEANPEKVQAALISLDLPFIKLYNVYRKIDIFDYDDDGMLPAHFLKAFASLIQSFMQRNKYLNVDDGDRKSVLAKSLVDVEGYLKMMVEGEDYYNPRLIQRYSRLYDHLQNFSV